MDTILKMRPPGRDVFFAPIQLRSNALDLERVEFAYEASKAAHAKQLRKDGVTRYFDHPKRATWIYIHELDGHDMEIVIDILLHDTGEDSFLLSLPRMQLNFGKERALDNFALTKLGKGKETVTEYLQRVIERGPRTIVSKLCDRLDNVRDISNCSKEVIIKLIEETEQYHVPLLINALRGYGGDWDKMASLINTKLTVALEAAKSASK